MWGGLILVVVFGIWLEPGSRFGAKQGIPQPVTSYGYTPYGKNKPGDWKESPYGGGRRLPTRGCDCHP